MNCLGLRRNRVWIGLGNLYYNIGRFSYLERVGEVIKGELCQHGPKERRGAPDGSNKVWTGKSEISIFKSEKLMGLKYIESPYLHS